jgi:hypothetical protein
MMYKAKIAVCWDPYKTLKEKRAPCRIFECQTWWYVKKPLGLEGFDTKYCLQGYEIRCAPVNPVVTIWTTCCNIKAFRILPAPCCYVYNVLLLQ